MYEKYMPIVDLLMYHVISLELAIAVNQFLSGTHYMKLWLFLWLLLFLHIYAPLLWSWLFL